MREGAERQRKQVFVSPRSVSGQQPLQNITRVFPWCSFPLQVLPFHLCLCGEGCGAGIKSYGDLGLTLAASRRQRAWKEPLQSLMGIVCWASAWGL